MLIRLHRLRDSGVPIPRYQFAFKATVAGELTIGEERDQVLNRYTRVAKLRPAYGGELLVPMLLDAQVVELTRERLIISGLERIEDPAILKTIDFAQTWLCWFDGLDTPLT